MKTSLSSFDLRTLVAEWQDLVGGHLDKAYQREDEVILRINAPAGGKAELFYKAGRWLCLHEVENKPESPPPFAQTLRRLLANARIASIEQSGFDRIAVFHLEHGGGTVDLVFEVFGKGNVVVRDGVTVAAMFPQTFKDRSVQVGEPYVFPRPGIDPLGLDRDAFARTLRAAKGQVVRVLASILNLGGTYAEELCLRASIDKETKVKEISDPQVDALYTALNNIAVAVDQERRPAVVFREGHAIDATPIELIQYRDLERREFPIFNGALSHYLTVAEPETATAAEMEAAQAKAVKVAKRPRIKSTKAMWFEAYRWTISSEGFLILGGRDARTNDQLVKKHLKEGDRYAHADIHGAPSTVIKDGARAPETTLREACEFALAYSKAWSAGLASGSAYWVLPEQVSKQAESGEFLPRAAFVIRGKRNYFHDLPVRLAIGEVEIEGHRKIMGGPVSAVAARSSRYAVLLPGKEDREEVAKRLASVFTVPMEEVVRVMPPGKVQIEERHGLDGETRGT